MQAAEARDWQALSDLLPNVNGRVAETRQIVNLAAFGFPLPAGIPSIVGPFNVSTPASRSDTVESSTSRRSTTSRPSAQSSPPRTIRSRSARDLVVLVTANAYLQALAAAARAESAQAQMRTAEALSTRRTISRPRGLVAGIDVLRSQLQFSTQRQRNTATQNDAEKVKLQLARVVGLPTGQAFTLVDELPNDSAVPT